MQIAGSKADKGAPKWHSFRILGAAAILSFMSQVQALASDAPSLAWERGYNAPANGVDEAWGVAVDAGGNVIVVGFEIRSDLSEAQNWLVRKYDAAGILLWSRTYNYAGASNDEAQEVALDSSGNIVVAGWANWASNASGSFLTRKYDPNGNLLWSRTYNSGVPDDHMGLAVDVDSSGNAVVVGFEDRADLGQGPNWRILKYDSAGALVWTRNYHQSSQDEARDVRTDASGNVYIGGWVNGGSGGWLLRKYDSSGNLIWSKPGSSLTGTPGACWGLDINSAGDIYAVGDESVPGEGVNWLVQKWDSNGNLIWSRSHNGPTNSNDLPGGVRLLTDGSIVVVGYDMFDGGGNQRWLMRSYDPNGTLLWSRSVASATAGQDTAMDVASGSEGSFVAVGWNTVAGENHNWRIQKYTTSTAYAASALYYQHGGDIWRIRPDGTGAEMVSHDAAYAYLYPRPSFQLGKLFVGRDEGSGNTYPVAMGLTGGTVTKLSTNRDCSTYVVPSPLGQYVFYTWNTGYCPNIQVNRVNVDGTGDTPVLSGANHEIVMDASGDGKILYNSIPPGNTYGADMYEAKEDGTSPVKLSTSVGAYWNMRYSPDQTKILYHEAYSGSTGDLFVINRNGTGKTNLTNDGASYAGASWSPDGLKIAFARQVGGIFQLFVMNADGTGQTQITALTTDADYPAWATVASYKDPIPPPCTTCPPVPPPTSEGALYVYPHPLKCPGGNAVFAMDKAGTAVLNIVNMRGQVVKTLTRDLAKSTAAEIFIDCHDVKNGAYLIQGELTYADGIKARLKPFKFVVAGNR